MTTNIKRLLTILFSVVLLLLIPLVGMQFSKEINWSLTDFLITGALLLSTRFLIKLVVRKVSRKTTLLILSITIFLSPILIWIELAVGIYAAPISIS